jgi:hypothetical protein
LVCSGCPLDGRPCHADTYREVANRPRVRTKKRALAKESPSCPHPQNAMEADAL